jgi:hypothetical protein
LDIHPLQSNLIKKNIHPSFDKVLRNSKTGIFKLRVDYMRPIKSGNDMCEDVDQSAVQRNEKVSDYNPENFINYMKKLA